MNSSSSVTRNRVATLALTMALTFALSGLAGVWSAPPDGDSQRMARKMNVLEKIFDEVLGESPNIFVSGNGATRGLFLDGYGALFTFEGSLTGGGLGYFALGNSNRAFVSGGGEWTVPSPAPPPKPPKAPKSGEEEVRVPSSVEDLAESWDVRREERAKEAREHLAGLKIELSEALLDYGATLGELTDDQWVVVAAFLDGFGYDGDGPERLVFKARMGDLREYSSGRLTLDQARTRVSIEEK